MAAFTQERGQPKILGDTEDNPSPQNSNRLLSVQVIGSAIR
jgi:hypothetical protein